MIQRLLLLTLSLLLCPLAYAQMYDKQLIAGFMESVRPLSNQDEGILSLDETRTEKIQLVLDETLPFFYLPSTVSTIVKCISGDCVNGYGKVSYPSVGAQYEGYFKNGYPDSVGLVTAKNGLSLQTFMKKGEMVGWQAFGIRKDTFTPLEVYVLHGRISEVKNMFWPEQKMIYTGKVNSQLKPNDKNGLVKGSNFEVVVYLDYDGNLISLFGKVDYGNFLYHGPLTKSMRFKSGGSFYHKTAGTKATPRIATDGSGKIYYDLVTLEKGDSMYIGSTNKEFQPHGNGMLRISNSEVNSGIWRNGSMTDSTGTYYAFQEKKDSLSLHQQMVEKIEFNAGVNAWNNCMYKGSPLNYFFLEAKETMYTHPTLYVFNTSPDTLNLQVSPQIEGFAAHNLVLPPTFQVSDSTGLQWMPSGVTRIPLTLPSINQPYTVYVSGAMPDEYYLLVK